MSLYRVMCVEPESQLLLYYEESADLEPMVEFFKRPLDEAYLMKIAKTHPDAESVIVTVEERTESTDWSKKFFRTEFLP